MNCAKFDIYVTSTFFPKWKRVFMSKRVLLSVYVGWQSSEERTMMGPQRKNEAGGIFTGDLFLLPIA